MSSRWRGRKKMDGEESATSIAGMYVSCGGFGPIHLVAPEIVGTEPKCMWESYDRTGDCTERCEETATWVFGAHGSHPRFYCEGHTCKVKGRDEMRKVVRRIRKALGR